MKSHIERVVVCGAGAMGSQIALVIALSGKTVQLFDISSEQLNNARELMSELLNRKVDKGAMSASEMDGALSRVQYVSEIGDLQPQSDLVVEAVSEDLGIKKKVFTDLNSHLSKTTILATNSSSIVSSKLCDVVENPARVCNLHFFNPAMVMPLVEVVQGPHTDPEITARLVEFAKEIGKTPIRIEKEVFGFVTNRLLSAVLDEAIWLLEHGVASFEDIDIAARKGLNHPLGPFELLDLTGIDVNFGIKTQQALETNDPSQGPSKTLTDLFEAGHLGKKSGQGFYDYSKGA